MSMLVAFYALSVEQLEEYRRLETLVASDNRLTQSSLRNDDDWGDVMPGGNADPEVVLEVAKYTAVLDWESFGLSFVLGSPANELNPTIFGRGLEMEVLDSSAVKEANQLLGEWTAARIKEAWSPEEMITQDIYPSSAWGEEGCVESIVWALETVKELYEKASSNDCVVLIGC